MKLFDCWNDVLEAYESFKKESVYLSSQVVKLLQDFCNDNDTLKNAIFKMFKGNCDGFSILVKEKPRV
ncbi:hypothetical protein HPAKL117_04220 [Helicobacter pylori Aklavik117]|uniref:hypothetical protein n=1 Tax=Helicobacter pylori TaxID=210 RepID=UPI00029CEEA4|nr:hypothetical protein [Helicobacter pylori]AFX91244.1 hypothetical protein HPAKL117_04220 [Helicobacter pylori Aklavik117]